MSLVLVVLVGTDYKIENNIIVVRQNSLYQIIAPGEGVSSFHPVPLPSHPNHIPTPKTYKTIVIERTERVKIGLYLLD